MQLSLMKEIFLNHPVKVTTLVDASKVKNLLEHEQFDLVLSDIQMPNIDGFELVRIIRNNNNPKIASIPVIEAARSARCRLRIFGNVVREGSIVDGRLESAFLADVVIFTSTRFELREP